jgi:hypothetical protein
LGGSRSNLSKINVSFGQGCSRSHAPSPKLQQTSKPNRNHSLSVSRGGGVTNCWLVSVVVVIISKILASDLVNAPPQTRSRPQDSTLPGHNATQDQRGGGPFGLKKNIKILFLNHHF